MSKRKKLYVDVSEYENPEYPYQAFIGGRGTGKTYSACEKAFSEFRENHEKFIWMRRTMSELEALSDTKAGQEGLNPFKDINANNGWNYGLSPLKKNTFGIYHREYVKERFEPTGDVAGYGLALSTIASIRGISASDTTRCFYDEFIPERHVKKIKDEAAAFFNAMETIQRNREIAGLPPMFVYLLANSFNIYNPIFAELGVIGKVEKAINSQKEHIYIKERGLAIHLLKSSDEFIARKSQTSLYRLTQGTRFYDMALNNQFAYNDFSLIKYRKVTGYRPVCHCNDIYVWQKKGEREFYISYTPGKCVAFDVNTIHDKRNFFNTYGKEIRQEFIYGNCVFESYELKERMLELLNID